MKNLKKDLKKSAPVLLAVLVAGAGFSAYLIYGHAKPGSALSITPHILGASADGSIMTNAPSLTQRYSNTTFGFSLRMPADFHAGTVPSGKGTAIVLQNAKGDGIQILVTPYGSDLHDLTAGDIRAAIPNLTVSDVQQVDIGASYKGVAFRSDNQAFGGDSREVWFVFRGNLYQISTYGRLDSLLKAMFGTWNFT